MGDLKRALSQIDLASLDLDSVDGLDPQMARVLRSVQKWSTETVAHQNHNSHGDSAGGIDRPTEGYKASTLRRASE
jgi:hypothetical protein